MVQVFQHQDLEGFVRAATRLDYPLETFTFLGQNFVLAAGLGVQFGEDRIRFGFGIDPFSIGFGFGIDDDTRFLGFGRGF